MRKDVDVTVNLKDFPFGSSFVRTVECFILVHMCNILCI